MSCICLKCRNHFASEDSIRKEECVGEFWGTPAYETYYTCPICGSDEIEDAVICEKCGTAHTKDEVTLGVCDTCIEQYKNKPEECYRIAEGTKTKVSINAFLADVLREEQIEEILMNYIRSQKDFDCSDFIDSDREWFADRINK